jgi:GGDEF domain-containing protein
LPITLLKVKPVISIRESIADIEKMHQLRAAAVDCYLSALRNIAQYAIELEDGLTGPFKKHISSLAGEVAGGDAEAIQESRDTLRGLLRDYRDKASLYLSSLRGELESTTSALQEMMESLNQSDDNHDVRLRTAVGRLREVCLAPGSEPLRAVVRQAADTIEDSLEQLRKQHQVTIAQFHMELRVLHQRIDALETAAAVDHLGQLLKRGEMEMRLAGIPRGSSLLLIKVRGIRMAESTFHPDIATELTGAFTRRLRNTLPPETEIARWSHEEFLAALPTHKEEAVTLAKWIAEHLSGAYSCLHEGKAVRPTLHLSVGVIEHVGEPVEQLLAKVGEFLRGDDPPATSAKGGPHRLPGR